MRTPFWRSVVGIFAALTLAVTACGSGDGSDNGGANSGGDRGTTDTGVEPALQLASSVEALAEESFKVEMSMGEFLTATGAVDGPRHAARIAMSTGMEGQSLDVEMIVTEADMWMNMGDLSFLLGVEAPWMHLDTSRLGGEGFMGVKPGEVDFAGTAEMMKALGDVERVDDTTFRGEIDLTRAGDTVLDEQMLAGQTTLRFTATLDSQGRLTEMRVDFPEMEGLQADALVVRYYDFGQPVDISPPPADQVGEAPEELYQMLGMFGSS